MASLSRPILSFQPRLSLTSFQGFEEATLRVNPPSVVFDNESDPVSTLVKVDSANKQGCLLQVVRLLTDLDLVISKAYISSDGGWFVDVFHVVDQLGQKVTDESLIQFIKKALGATKEDFAPDARTCLGKPVADAIDFEHSVIELTGYDRPGLLYEVSEVLTKLGCNVVGAEVWTHNNRVAIVVHITQAVNGGPVTHPAALAEMHDSLCSVMESDSIRIEARHSFFVGEAQTDQRLHQLMFADRDYEAAGIHVSPAGAADEKLRFEEAALRVNPPRVVFDNHSDPVSTLVKVDSANKQGCLLQVVQLLTDLDLVISKAYISSDGGWFVDVFHVVDQLDMQYIIHHATIESENDIAHQEYYVRTMDGSMLDTEAERERVGKCLEAAILRRSPRVSYISGALLMLLY
ncbi:unnamed protein product [Closterium sp. Naga37s-1]|nr:unnamed protein product [Closterium sp. Naga37s-1]